jgi:pimeloyl-ACP methyl ester carboxylesterase
LTAPDPAGGHPRSQVHTRSGSASYIDTAGPGRAALFLHGVGTSSYLWRHVIDQLAGQRRCVAVDLPLHGQTPAAVDQDFSLPGLARFVADFCDALELTDFDLVANDTGGAIAQVFAVRSPERLHTLTLTNCEAHDNLPPKALLPGVLLARMGLIAHLAPRMVRDIPGPASASTAAAPRTSPTCPTMSSGPGWNRSPPPNRLVSSSA